MDHRRFEELLFAEEPLAEAQQAELEAHLAECEACRLLAAAWRDLAPALAGAAAEVAAPEPGFAARWQRRLAAERARRARRQAWLALLLTLGAALPLAWPLLAALALALASPGRLLYESLARLVVAVAHAQRLWQALTIVANGLEGTIGPALILALVTGLAGLAALWLAWMVRLNLSLRGGAR